MFNHNGIDRPFGCRQFEPQILYGCQNHGYYVAEDEAERCRSVGATVHIAHFRTGHTSGSAHAAT